MNDKELIRRALMGDKKAQMECTEKEIALPCPFCGKDDCIFVMDCYTAHGDICDCNSYKKREFVCVCNYLEGGCGTQIGISQTTQEALAKWNTRPTLPIGRCVECAAYGIFRDNQCANTGCYRTERDFCSDFHPKEGK